MRPLAILGALPPRFRVELGREGALAVSDAWSDAFRAAGYGPDGGETLTASDLAGRKPLFELEAGGRRFVVRRFSHGGLLRWLTGERFLDPERPFRELRLASELSERGIPTAEVVAARARKAPIGGYYLEVVTARVEDSIDLGRALDLDPTGPARRAVFLAAGRFVRSLHDAGLVHADLNPRNLLVSRDALEGEPPRFWVLDLDRSRLGPPATVGERRANLRRLYRHVARRASEGAVRVGRSELERFLVGYEPDRAERRAHARAIRRDHQTRRVVHAAGWALERRFGRAHGTSAAGAGSPSR